MDLKDYAWVSEKDDYTYYRSILNPKDEIRVKGNKKKKVKIKDEI